MHAVVNKLSLGKPIDLALLDKINNELVKQLSDNPEFVSLQIVSVSDFEAVLVALYQTEEGMNELSKTIAAPWFADNVRPYLSGPVDRVVGKVVLNYTNG